ncbi:MAG: hypothetical protein GY757_48530, partial [bacterium]|nr:hypothetical protein [bacterium]
MTTAATVVPFRFESNEVRTLTIDGNPWFVAKDVCNVITNARDTLAKSLDDDEKGVENIYTPGGPQQIAVISESGLYTLILRSNKPAAKPFRRWVTSEVLPAIRKTGSYQQPGAGTSRKPESLTPVAREFRAALRLARGMGLRGRQAVQAAGRLACDQTGFNPLELFAADLPGREKRKSEESFPAPLTGLVSKYLDMLEMERQAGRNRIQFTEKED